MGAVSSAFDQKRFRFYSDDGTEGSSTAFAAEDTNISLNVYNDASILLRVQLQEQGVGSGASTDDFQLQVSKNGAAYANVTTASSNVKAFNSAFLTDAGITTARLTAGTGSFVAGKISEDGLLDNHAITASNYTEFVYTLTVISADVAATNTLDFKVLVNSGALNAYTVIPRITVTKTAPAASTTNVLLGFAEIPLASSTTTVSLTASTTYPLVNLFGGSRFDIFKVATATSGDCLLTFDLGASTTKSANFIYFAKANLLKYDDVGTITVKAHTANNYGAATTITTLSSFGSTTLQGPHEEDYVSIFAESAAYRYWFVNYNASAASNFAHSKMFLGKLFDPGMDPTPNIEITRVREIGGRRKALYTFRLHWDGLTYAKAKTMHETFSRTRRYNPVILVTQSYHEPLHSHRVIIGRVTEFSSPPVATDYNSVSMTVEEMY
jgi:hypothetical protein